MLRWTNRICCLVLAESTHLLKMPEGLLFGLYFLVWWGWTDCPIMLVLLLKGCRCAVISCRKSGNKAFSLKWNTFLLVVTADIKGEMLWFSIWRNTQMPANVCNVCVQLTLFLSSLHVLIQFSLSYVQFYWPDHLNCCVVIHNIYYSLKIEIS